MLHHSGTSYSGGPDAPNARGSGRRRRSGFAGFTLIELLVVVAIIAILAGFLFPVFAQARAKARQAACLSNVKQLSMGIMMYTQDHDEFLPYGYAYTWPGQEELYYWHDLVRPYIKADQLYTCPSASSHSVTDYKRPRGLVNPLILDYVANGRVAQRTGNRSPLWVPQGVYPCSGKEEWIAITVRDDVDWHAFCGVAARQSGRRTSGSRIRSSGCVTSTKLTAKLLAGQPTQLPPPLPRGYRGWAYLRTKS